MGRAMMLTVVAIPNGRLSVSGGALYVNDVRVGEFSPEFVARVAAAPERVPAEVPADHYFVMGGQRSNRDVSEHAGIASRLRAGDVLDFLAP